MIAFDPEIQMLRGEFVGLNGGADFYAESVHNLIEEGRKSLAVYLEMCREKVSSRAACNWSRPSLNRARRRPMTAAPSSSA
ncbi:type II toxin-antitoxin system HicB family antitoxin [Mesorhizobium sp. SB112]|uniref:type II toxin-antitoxin system HicB family antitoxin n=1 Tax=Mesorhizobium sp. SB112 TaxID=3151853 RepID=UPI0032657BD9